MGENKHTQELNGGIVCLTLILIAAVGAIAGGTLVLTVVTFVAEEPEPVEVAVGGVPQAVPVSENDDDYYHDYDDKIWTISSDYYSSAQVYLDEESGQVRGLNIDVIEAVCRLANKNCQLIRDKDANVWDNGFGGQGLLAGWFDAAQGWDITYPRLRTFSFTEPLSKAQPSFFGVQRGNPRDFDWKDLTGKKIGFLNGILADEVCLRRHADEIRGSDLSNNQIVILEDEQDLIDAVNDGEVDAAFISKEYTDAFDNLEQNGPDLTRCQIGGAALMTRKDSHFAAWWDPAWRRLLNSAKYNDICRDFDTVHNFFGQSSADFCF